MTTVDTNILIPILNNDDVDQSRRGAVFMRPQDRVYLLKTVLLETEWVLRSSCGFDCEAITAGMRSLLTATNLEIENSPAVFRALHWYH